MKRLVVCAALALAACGPQQGATKDQSATTRPGSTSGAPAATPSGPAVKIAPRGDGEGSDDVSVARVVPLGEKDAKLFSTVGGDPAINGEYVFLAIPSEDGPAEAPKVYKLGDFNSWSLESQSPGAFVIQASRSWIDTEGAIQTRQERYLVALPSWSATETTITPAN